MRTWGALTASTVLYAAAVVWAATRMPPDGIPLHFGATGTADRLGSRSAALTMMILLGVLVLGLGIGLVLLARRGPLTVVNIPHRSYWSAEHRQPELRRKLADDAAFVMSLTTVLLSLIPIATVLALTAQPVAAPPVLLWVSTAAYIAALLAWCVWLARHRYRPPAEHQQSAAASRPGE